MSYLYTQRGVSLVELLVVLTILGILAGFAIPSLNEFLIRRDIDATRADLTQSLSLARQVARAENTLVSVKLKNNVLNITPQNGGQEKIINFSSRIKFISLDNASELEFIFRPVGTIGKSEGDQVIDLLSDLKIKIQPSEQLDNMIEEIVTVGNYGRVASN